jgi:hypothetical protein
MPGKASKMEWVTIPAKMENGHISAPLPPADANMLFFNATDNRGATVSSVVKTLPGKSRPSKSGIHPNAHPVPR